MPLASLTETKVESVFFFIISPQLESDRTALRFSLVYGEKVAVKAVG